MTRFSTADHFDLIRLLALFLDVFEDSMTEEEKDAYALNLVLVTDRLGKPRKAPTGVAGPARKTGPALNLP